MAATVPMVKKVNLSSVLKVRLDKTQPFRVHKANAVNLVPKGCEDTQVRAYPERK